MSIFSDIHQISELKEKLQEFADETMELRKATQQLVSVSADLAKELRELNATLKKGVDLKGKK